MQVVIMKPGRSDSGNKSGVIAEYESGELFNIEFFLYNRPIYQNKQEPSCEYPKKRSHLMMCC